MNAPAKPLVYLVLGAAGSGRREVLVDLIGAGLEATDHPAVLLPATEAAIPIDTKLPQVERWSVDGEVINATLPDAATHVFFIVDGRRNPVDQAEQFKVWLESQDAEFARALCVVNCQLAEKNPPLLAWFDACVHFSDVVLLNHREGVENKWLSGFLAHFKKQFSPAIFELVKEGQVKNPALVLVPEARRMTHAFDEEQDWIFTNAEGEEVDEQEEVDDEDELEAKPEEDPYFARRLGGRREIVLPDIAKFL
jgi:hypothetical protein